MLFDWLLRKRKKTTKTNPGHCRAKRLKPHKRGSGRDHLHSLRCGRRVRKAGANSGARFFFVFPNEECWLFVVRRIQSMDYLHVGTHALRPFAHAICCPSVNVACISSIPLFN